jgi:hypothetical protein
MKRYLASLLALVALTYSTQAQSNVVLTGAVSYRSAIHKSIYALLAQSGAVQAAYTGTDVNNANAAIFTGTFPGVGPVRIKTSWAGAVGGVQTVAASNPVKTTGVFADNQTVSAITLSGGNWSGGTNNQTDPRTAGPTFARPDIAITNTTQDSTLFNGTYLGVTYSSLIEPAGQQLGADPFIFVTSKDGSTGTWGQLGLTSQTFRAIWALGFAPLSLLSGNSAHQGVLVVATGRDIDAGQRAQALAETGYGIQQPVVQYKPTVSGSAISSLSKYPATTVNGVPSALGNGGENSSSTLASNLGKTGPTASILNSTFGTSVTSSGFLISYVNLSDLATVTAAGGQALNYNGAPYTLSNVQEGSYTFWAYQHLYVRQGTTGTPLAVASAIATDVINNTALIPLTSLNVGRQTDGGVIGSNLY